MNGPGALRMAVMFVLLVAILGMGSGVASPSTARAASDGLDLPAILIHTADLDWIVTEQGDLSGHLDDAPYVLDTSLYFSSTDEVVGGPYYLRGRGGFLPAASNTVDLADLLDETGWRRTVDAFMVRQSNLEGSWVTGIAASIEEYETEAGAEEAFAAFIDADALAEIAQAVRVEEVEAPDLGDESVMWSLESEHWEPPAIPVVTLWVRIDNLIVSVAEADATQVTEPDPARVERVMETQLQRLEHAEHLYQPRLSACSPRLQGDGVRTLSDAYLRLNDRTFAVWGDTYRTVLEWDEEQDARGMVDMYRVRQAYTGTERDVVDGTLFYTVGTRSFVDGDAASAYVGDLGEILDAEGRQQLVELDDVPGLGDAARAFSYVGNSGSPSVVVYVLTGELVFSVFLGSSDEPLQEVAYDLAELYLERLEAEDCAGPVPVPDWL